MKIYVLTIKSNSLETITSIKKDIYNTFYVGPYDLEIEVKEMIE